MSDNGFPKLPWGYRWEVEAAPPAVAPRMIVKIVFMWVSEVERTWVDTWPLWTEERIREATLAAAQRAWDNWQSRLHPCVTPQGVAKQIEKELNA